MSKSNVYLTSEEPYLSSDFHGTIVARPSMLVRGVYAATCLNPTSLLNITALDINGKPLEPAVDWTPIPNMRPDAVCQTRLYRGLDRLVMQALPAVTTPGEVFLYREVWEVHNDFKALCVFVLGYWLYKVIRLNANIINWQNTNIDYFQEVEDDRHRSTF